MCSIYGIIERGHGSVEEKLRSMSKATFHRGPDDVNWSMPDIPGYRVGYGINRLAIIDVAGGRQPISNEDGSLEVVFNGEIYNYKTLTEELISKGHVFKTESDTECIVHLYEEYGPDCVHHLRGMFAIQIFDRNRQTVFIARDHVGIKPMYYSHQNGSLAFASEIKGLLTLRLNPEINPDAVLSYFTFRYVLAPNTIYKGINSLPAGHYLLYNYRTDRVTVRRWWEVDCTPTSIPYNDAKERLRELLTESVKLRLQSEVPLGAFLSGGVDSSLIASIVAKELDHEINVYNIGYQGANEYQYAGAISRDLGFNYYQVCMSFDDMTDVLDDVVHHMDQPLSDAACFPSLFLSRIVKHGCTVMLSGEGADELFAGYWQYEGLMSARRPHDLSEDAFIEHLGRSSYFMTGNRLFTIDTMKTMADPLQTARDYFNNKTAQTLLSKVLCTDIGTWLPDDLLMKVDKMTMAASVEARVPFLDKNLIEFVASLPDGYKYGQGVTKRILKDVAEDMGVPPTVARRPKMGFTVPIHELLTGPFRGRLRDAIRSQRFRSLDYIDHQRVNQVVNEYYAGETHWSLFCWTLFIFTQWLGSDRRP